MQLGPSAHHTDRNMAECGNVSLLILCMYTCVQLAALLAQQEHQVVQGRFEQVVGFLCEAHRSVQLNSILLP